MWRQKIPPPEEPLSPLLGVLTGVSTPAGVPGWGGALEVAQLGAFFPMDWEYPAGIRWVGVPSHPRSWQLPPHPAVMSRSDAPRRLSALSPLRSRSPRVLPAGSGVTPDSRERDRPVEPDLPQRPPHPPPPRPPLGFATGSVKAGGPTRRWFGVTDPPHPCGRRSPRRRPPPARVRERRAAVSAPPRGSAGFVVLLVLLVPRSSVTPFLPPQRERDRGLGGAWRGSLGDRRGWAQPPASSSGSWSLGEGVYGFKGRRGRRVSSTCGGTR